MNTKAQALADWYQRLANNGNGFIFNHTTGTKGPDLRSKLKHYRINPPKPKIKKIDLSVCIESGVDCEFKQNGMAWHINKLDMLNPSPTTIYHDLYDQCRVRQDHWHSHQGNKCPIPEGLKGSALRRDNFYMDLDEVTDWKHNPLKPHNDIIAFRVLSIAEGWEY